MKLHNRGGERMVEEREERSAACHPSSAWRTWRLHDSPLCPEQSSRIHIHCLVGISACSMCTYVLCIGTPTTWKHHVLPCFCQLFSVRLWSLITICPHTSHLGTYMFSPACKKRLNFKVFNMTCFLKKQILTIRN